MAMTEDEHKALRTYCAFILKQYGFHFAPTDPVIPALYIIHKEMQLNNHKNKILADVIKSVSDKITITSRTYHFNSQTEAWKLKIADTFKWISISGFIIITLVTGVWYWSLNEIDEARQIIQRSDRSIELMKRIKKDEAGFYFLEFTKAKGSSIQNFTEFQNMNGNTIRIYLGKAKN